MTKFLIPALLGLTAATAAYAQAPAAAPAAAAAAQFSTENTDVGTLIDNPQTKAIVDKHIPGFSSNPQIEKARGMTLRAIQPYAGDQVTDAALAAIDADLAKLPAKK